MLQVIIMHAICALLMVVVAAISTHYTIIDAAYHTRFIFIMVKI